VKTVTILGATGSVGRSTLDLVERNLDRFEILALTAMRDVAGLADAARRVGARRAVIGDEARLPALREALAGTGVEAAGGEAALIEAAASGADWTMAAIVGCAGLRPVMAALRGGGTVALANKEALVSAGEIMTEAARASGATLLPGRFGAQRHLPMLRPVAARLRQPDHPHRQRRPVSRRASRRCAAPPRRGGRASQLVDGRQDLGGFGDLDEQGAGADRGLSPLRLPQERSTSSSIPQSVIHSLVEYVDGSVLAQLGAPDMRIPIAYTLAWPERMETPCERLDLVAISRFDFEAPDLERFPRCASPGNARGGRRKAGNPQCRQRDSRRFLP
jgi:1-deoxy-D-xylulose-5-phosphate reductoisomerase